MVGVRHMTCKTCKVKVPGPYGFSCRCFWERGERLVWVNGILKVRAVETREVEK